MTVNRLTADSALSRRSLLSSFLLLAALLPLAGCYRDFTPQTDAVPVLCINSMIKAGEPVEATVTHTRLFTDMNGDMSVPDAVLTVYADGVPVDSDYIPREGDRIRLVAESRTYGRAEAEVEVPVAVPIVSVAVIPENVSVSRTDLEDWDLVAEVHFSLLTALEIADRVGSRDYYRFSYAPFGVPSGDRLPDNQFWPGTFRYEAEPIFSEHVGGFEAIAGGDGYGFMFFTDRQFSDSSYTLHISITGNRCFLRCYNLSQSDIDCGFDFTLYTVSESAYDWANFVWQRDDGPLGDLGDFGFADPLWGYSNVSSGAGVVAACSSVTVHVSLLPFLEEVLGIDL